MRLLESAAHVLAAVTLVATVLRGDRWRRLAPLGAVALGAVLVLHGALEGTRWQLAPLYVLSLGLVVAGGLRLLREERPRNGASRAGGVLLALVGVAALAVSALLGVVLPVPSLPDPLVATGDETGEGIAPVGTAVWVLETGRLTPYGEGAGSEARRLPVQAWYPMPAGTPQDPSPAVEDAPAFGRETAAWLGLPPFVLNHLDLVDTHATLDGPVAGGPHPLVVYSHGWGGFRSVQASLMEHLAARGFVVVAPDHVGGAVAARFPAEDDGGPRVVGIDPAALPDERDVGQQAYDTAAAALVDTYATDVGDLLADLLSVDPQAPGELVAATDAGEVLLLGHSTGGGAAVAVCGRLADADDTSCAGVLGHDPWVEPVVTLGEARGLDAPFHAVRSAEWVGNENDAVLGPLLADGTDGSAVSMPRTGHRDFTLFGFLTPLASELGLTGEADTATVHDALHREAVAFARRTLLGDAVALPSEQDDPAFRDDGLLAVEP